MSHETPGRSGALTTALAEAAATAGYAPSVHNTQPWRWRVCRTRWSCTPSASASSPPPTRRAGC